MSSVAAARPPARNVRPFGPHEELLYTITEARGEPRLGAILWGLGVAEVKIARALAKRGIVSMQVRINGPEFYDDARRNEIYRRSGIDYCRLAMDKLAAERGVTSFILMGTCACANLGFHAARADPRVAGLIVANPYVSTAQRVRTLGWEKFSKPGGGKRLWTAGTRHARAAFTGLWRFVGARFRSATKHAAESSPPAGSRQAIELPGRFARELRKLCDRGSKILIACSTTDDSLHYLRKRHGSDLRKLQARGNLSFVEVECSAHSFSTDDSAAALLHDAIARWIETTAFVSGAATASRRTVSIPFGTGAPAAR